MEIAVLGIAMVYLLAIAAGSIGALLVLVWLFGEAPDESKGNGRETVGVSPSTERFGAVSTTAASGSPERSEGKAA